MIGDLGQRNLVIWPCWGGIYSPSYTEGIITPYYSHADRAAINEVYASVLYFCEAPCIPGFCV